MFDPLSVSYTYGSPLIGETQLQVLVAIKPSIKKVSATGSI